MWAATRNSLVSMPVIAQRIPIIGLYLISERFLRAASRFDRRGRIRNFETVALDLLVESFNLRRVGFQGFGSRVTLWNRREPCVLVPTGLAEQTPPPPRQGEQSLSKRRDSESGRRISHSQAGEDS